MPSLADVLSYTTYLDIVNAIRDGVPSVVPPAFLAEGSRGTGDEGRYTVVKSIRRTARQTAYGGPAKRRELRPIGTRPVKLIHSFESQMVPIHVLMNLRDYTNSGRQRLGEDEIARQAGLFRDLFDNLRIMATQLALSKGELRFDNGGELVLSGGVLTIDMLVPAGNKNQLDVDGSGDIITASWATTTTNIPLHLRQLRKESRKLSGYPVDVALYGENIPQYFTDNNFIKDYMARNPQMNDEFLRTRTGEIPNGLFGFEWVPCYESFYEDSAGTNQEAWSADTIVFTPSPSVGEWRDLITGSYPVPTSVNFEATMEAALATIQEVWGKFGFAKPAHNPTTIEQFFGDTFLPVFPVPEAVFIADVTP